MSYFPNKVLIMATITINDIRTNHDLDSKAMARITGAGGAPWVYGWISPYVDVHPSFGSAVSFYQTNNIYVADQMINQIQMIDINNSAPNANINVSPKQEAINFKLLA